MRFVLSWGLRLSSGRGRVREIVRAERTNLRTRRRLVEHAERANQIQKRRRIVRRFDQRQAIVETDALGANAKLLKHLIELRELFLLIEGRGRRRVRHGRGLRRQARDLSGSWRESFKRGLRGALKLNEVRSVYRRRWRKRCGKCHGVRLQHS